MPLKITGDVLYYGRKSTYSITIHLISHEETKTRLDRKPELSGQSGLTLSEAMKDGSTHFVVPIAFTDHTVGIAWRDIQAVYPDTDPNAVYLSYEVELQIDPTSERISVAEMMDELRQTGTSEEEIQRMLIEEAAYHNSQHDK